MLDGWLSSRDRCTECGLVYQRNPGDTWGFWIIGDRIPVAIAIAAVYFGLGPHTWIQGAFFFGAMAILMIATVPQRLGFVVALHYLSRRYWPDPDDPIPPTLPLQRRRPIEDDGDRRVLGCGIQARVDQESLTV